MEQKWSNWNAQIQIESFKYFPHAFTSSPQFDSHLTRVCEVVSGRPGAHVHFTPLQLLLTFYGGWGTLVLTKLCYLTIFSADINPSLSASAQILTRPRFSQNISWPRAVPVVTCWSMDVCDIIINVGMTSKIRQRRIYTKFTNIYWCSLCKIIAQLDTVSHSNSDIMIKQSPTLWWAIFST